MEIVEHPNATALPGAGDPYECELCATPLVTVASPDGLRRVVEVASGERHGCWQNLPRGAKVLRTQDD